MEITKEAVEKRKATLQVDYEQAIRTLQAIGGAIQDCDYWLAFLEKEVEPDKEKEQ